MALYSGHPGSELRPQWLWQWFRLWLRLWLRQWFRLWLHHEASHVADQRTNPLKRPEDDPFRMHCCQPARVNWVRNLFLTYMTLPLSCVMYFFSVDS